MMKKKRRVANGADKTVSEMSSRTAMQSTAIIRTCREVARPRCMLRRTANTTGL